jgi:hypothetical protein
LIFGTCKFGGLCGLVNEIVELFYKIVSIQGAKTSFSRKEIRKKEVFPFLPLRGFLFIYLKN